MTKTMTKTKVEVTESEARALMRALKATETADKGTPKRLQTKLNELPRWADSIDPPKDGPELELFNKLSRAVEDGEQIVVVADGVGSPGEGNGSAKKGTAGKAKPEPEAGELSNKARVFKLWQKSKDKTVAAAEGYFKAIGETVKLSTIKGWISAWNRGQNLPGIAK